MMKYTFDLTFDNCIRSGPEVEKALLVTSNSVQVNHSTQFAAV